MKKSSKTISPTRADLMNLQDKMKQMEFLQYQKNLHKYNKKSLQSICIQIRNTFSRISDLIRRIDTRFSESLILEVKFRYTDTSDPNTYQRYFTNVTEQDFRDYVAFTNRINPRNGIIILEIQEHRDLIKILPL